MDVFFQGRAGLDDVAAAAGGLDGLVGWMNLGFHDVVTVFAGGGFYQSRLAWQAMSDKCVTNSWQMVGKWPASATII